MISCLCVCVCIVQLHSPACLGNDHLCAGLVELLPQLPLMKHHLDVLDVLRRRRRDGGTHISQPLTPVTVKYVHVNTLMSPLLHFNNRPIDWLIDLSSNKISLSSHCVSYTSKYNMYVPGQAHWSWEGWKLWIGPSVTGLDGDLSPRRPGPGSYIHPSQLKPSPAASLQD